MALVGVRGMEAEIVSILQSISGLTVYDHEPKMLKVPCLTLDLRGYTRERNRMGKRLFRYEWDMNLYVAIEDAKRAADQLKEYLDKINQSVSQAPTLNGKAVEADIEQGEVRVYREQANPHHVCHFRFYATEGE
jgi:hypothetical protein